MLPSLLRHPRLALTALVLVGLVLRTWRITTHSMTHYDEFYYAQSGLDVWIVSSGAAGDLAVGTEASGDIDLPGTQAPAQPLNGLHPMLAFHAPPLYPILIALVHAFVGGPWYPAGALVSALLGTATIPLLYLLGKRVGQGELAGLTAAALLALSDFHVAYSRTWLTDVAFCFLFVAAMYCLARFFEDGRWLWTVPAGLTAGLAWNVKYNGWMPAAIGLTAWLVVVLRAKWSEGVGEAARQQGSEAEKQSSVARLPSRRLAVSPPRRFWPLALTAAIALLMFLPWFFYVQRYFPGGYASVAGHHASFSTAAKAWNTAPPGPGRVIGVLDGWCTTVRQLLEALPAFRHWGWCLALGGIVLAAASRLGVPIAQRREASPPYQGGVKGGRGGGASQNHKSPFSTPRRPHCARGAPCAALAVLGFATLFVGLDGMLFLAAIAAAVVCIACGRPLDVLVAVWLGAFVVSVPAYHAYPRLLVPALPAAILMLLRGWQWTTAEAGPTNSRPAVPRGGLLGARALCLMVLLAGTLAAGRLHVEELRGVWSRWSGKHSYGAFAGQVARKTPPQAWLLCRSQPTLWYALPRPFKGLDDQPLPHGDDLPPGRPAYLALDFHVHLTPAALASVRSRRGRLEEVARVANDLTPPAMLNLITPAEFWRKMRALGTSGAATPEAQFLPPRLQHPGTDWIILYRIGNDVEP